MTATFGDLIERARSFTRDTSGAFIEDEDLAVWINEAYKDIASRLQVLQREQDATTTSEHIPMPVAQGRAIYEITSLRFGTVDVEFVNDDLFNDWKDGNDVPPTTLGRIFDGNIELYPTPAVGSDYVLRYIYVPPDLVQASDRHVLPIQLERKLIEYAVAQAKMKDSDESASDRWFARYEQGLPPLATGRPTLQPGPMSFQPAQSWFEEDSRAHGAGVPSGSFTLSVTGSAMSHRLPRRAVDIGVARGVLVTLGTVGLQRPSSASKILGMTHWLKVAGIDTDRIPAEMVEFLPFWDRTNEELVNNPMGIQPVPCPVALLEDLTISVDSGSALPLPAPRSDDVITAKRSFTQAPRDDSHGGSIAVTKDEDKT